MKENVLTSFIRDTYKTTSIIPYVITGQVVLFILLHIFDLLSFAETTSIDLYSLLFSKCVLPALFMDFIMQPWSLFTHAFIYNSLWNLLFDCLWLYWIGNLFLTFLNTRQLNTLFLGGIAIGALLFIGLSFLPFWQVQNQFWHGTTIGLAAVISSLIVLIPNYEVRLFILGNIKLKWIAVIYLGFQFALLINTNKIAAFCLLFIICYGILFMRQLQQGKDWSLIFKRKKSNLKVIKNSYGQQNSKISSNYPNQQEIDQILDKISLKGYESLTLPEKELLFRASKKEN